MSELRERASNTSPDDIEALLQLAEAVRWDLDALPMQVGAADALKRSILSLKANETSLKLEVVRARFTKLLMTL
jgi:hypothetical protein